MSGDGFSSGRVLLRRLREQAGLTQAQLAERAGLSERAISDIERGEKRPRNDTLSRLATALEREASELPELEAAAFEAQLTACRASFEADARRRIASVSRTMPVDPDAHAEARVSLGAHWWPWLGSVAVAAVLIASALLVTGGLAGRLAPPGPFPASPQVVAPTPAIPILTAGTMGVNVKTVQWLLRHRGYADVAVTGSFDADTERAIGTFQAESGLVADGVVGPRTWGKLFVNVREGSLGDAVLAVQLQLNRKQGAALNEDGRFDPTLRAAVLAFQEQAHITVDGIVGPETWSHLVAMSAIQ
jgi:transcriptional regulator with XRE-family HTH domain